MNTTKELQLWRNNDEQRIARSIAQRQAIERTARELIRAGKVTA